MPADVIDLDSLRRAKSAPDSAFKFVDIENGAPVTYFKFFGEYDFDGKTWIVHIWATDQEQAQQKMAALSGVRYGGQIYSETPA